MKYIKCQQVHSNKPMSGARSPSCRLVWHPRTQTYSWANVNNTPLIWHRFIDDIFMVWTEGEGKLNTFIEYLNSIHSSIKFNHEYSVSSATTKSTQICTQNPLTYICSFSSLVVTLTTPRKLSHSASFFEYAVHAPPKTSLINAAKNVLIIWWNVDIVVPPYKEP